MHEQARCIATHYSLSVATNDGKRPIFHPGLNLALKQLVVRQQLLRLIRRNTPGRSRIVIDSPAISFQSHILLTQQDIMGCHHPAHCSRVPGLRICPFYPGISKDFLEYQPFSTLHVQPSPGLCVLSILGTLQLILGLW